MLIVAICSLLPLKANYVLFSIIGSNSFPYMVMLSLLNTQSYHDILLPMIKATKLVYTT